jgi:DNA-binding transcriptional LysR family regulator
LGDFVIAAPQVAVRLTVDNTERIVQAMLAHELDVGCVEGPVLPAELEWLHWRDDALLVCAPPSHPLALLQRPLRAEDFAGMAWVIREAGSATRGQTEQVLARLPPPGRRLELSQTEAIKQAVIAGLGVALLPAVAVQDALATQRLCALPVPFLAPLLARQLSLLLHRGGYRAGLLEAFLRATIHGSPPPPPEPPCSPVPTRLPHSIPNWPRPSPKKPAGRKTTSSSSRRKTTPARA